MIYLTSEEYTMKSTQGKKSPLSHFWQESNGRSDTDSPTLDEVQEELGWLIMKGIHDTNERRLEASLEGVKKGDANAQFDLAEIYRKGWGVRPDRNKSLTYYEAAAEQHHAGACLALLELYERGDSSMLVDKDLTEAKYYAELGLKGEGITKFDVPGRIVQCNNVRTLKMYSQVIDEEIIEEEKRWASLGFKPPRG